MSGNLTRLEFYLNGAKKYLEVIDSSAVPSAGHFISLRGETYKVVRVTWAVDYPDDIHAKRLRANVEITDCWIG